MNPITIQTIVQAPIEKVWRCWIEPEHISGWAFVSDDWEAVGIENDVRVGGNENGWQTMLFADLLAVFTVNHKTI